MGQIETGNLIESRFNPNLYQIKYSDLHNLLCLTRNFYSQNRIAIDYLINESKKAAEIIADEDGVLSVFSLGFPFYALNDCGDPVKVSEIDNFLDEVDKSITSDEEAGHSNWVCPSCQRTNLIPNVNLFCKPCERVLLKPRKILGAIPDLDMIAVVDEINPTLEQRITGCLYKSGYRQTDPNIYRSIIETNKALSLINIGIYPRFYKIPIDLHLWSKENFESSLNRIMDGETAVGISTRSLYEEWVDRELNFLFDFTFSLTTNLTKNNSIEQLTINARRSIANRYTNQEISQIIAWVSPRAKRLMECSPVMEVFLAKIEKWRKC